MLLYDRIKNKELTEKELPNRLELGRYLIYKDDESFYLTYSQYSKNKIIKQELLDEKNQSIQDNFVNILSEIEKSFKNKFEVIPLVQRRVNILELNDFEKKLEKKISHIEKIFKEPHYLLKREIEKVHVSRAKRIPSKSYQYLASHTEDWASKSIVNFIPSRILNEELELNFNVYENQLTVAFVERCLKYLSSRLKEIQDIKEFLELYTKLLKDRDDKNGWHRKIERNLVVIGAVYDDENYKKDKEDNKEKKNLDILSESEEKLQALRKRLLQLKKDELFNEVDKRSLLNIRLDRIPNTNVLVNQKHYKYVKELGLMLGNLRPEETEEEKIKNEQKVINGVIAYANSLITYCIRKYFDYEIIGNYNEYTCEHILYPKITFSKNEKNIFNISIGNKKLKIVVLASEPIEIKLNDNTIVLFYNENQSDIESDRFIRINPLDPDSVERIATLFRKYFIVEYFDNLNRQYSFKQELRDYIHLINVDYVEFLIKEFKYRFLKYPKNYVEINKNQIKSALKREKKYIRMNNEQKQNLEVSILKLIEDINNNSKKIKTDYLLCLECQQNLFENEVPNFEYIRCEKCNTVIINDGNHYKLKIDTQLIITDKKDWGMDFIDFKLDDNRNIDLN